MQTKEDCAINVRNLQKIFYSTRGFWRQTKHPVMAVEDISFEVRRGELFGMVGPNGAGKTTTVKMLATLLLPTGGSAQILEMDVQRDTARIRPRIGFTFGGNRGLYGRLSALDNLRYFAELYRLDPETIDRRIQELLEIVGLTGRERDRVETFSSGMQQRLHLARALLHDPDLLFLDEPTVGIDPVGSREIRKLIRELVGRGKTILLTTHYMYEAEELCDRIAVVNHGRIAALDTPARLKTRAAGDTVIVVHSPTENPELGAALEALRGEVLHLSNSGEVVSVHTRTPARILNSLAGLLERDVISNIEVRNATLEDVYVKIIQETPA